MDQTLLAQLQAVTAEEQAILDGRTTIDRGLYMDGTRDVIHNGKLLEEGKLITLRTHTRFIHFPAHTHDYVEVVYMCSGATTHLVNGREIRLEQGELLFLGQRAVHEVFRADREDVAVNFIVLPAFFSGALGAVGEETTPLRTFLLDCLSGTGTGPGYLYFRVAGDKPIQNLVENLLFALMRETPNRRTVTQSTMNLLLLQLLGHADKLAWEDREARLLRLLRYVEEHYENASLARAAADLHCDAAALSREIHRKTGQTYTQLVQRRRLTQAAYLLRTTNRKVEDISVAVGYENVSYFHRLFRQVYGCSPRSYRVAREDTFSQN